MLTQSYTLSQMIIQIMSNECLVKLEDRLVYWMIVYFVSFLLTFFGWNIALFVCVQRVLS